MKMLNIRRRGLATALGFAALAVVLPSVAEDADTYQYIKSGNQPANESYSAASEGIALVTATRRSMGAASALEARYRSMCESEGIGMRTDKCKGFLLLVR